MSARLDAENAAPDSRYPVRAMNRYEAAKVVAFGLHKPESRIVSAVFNDVEGMRAGVIVLGVVVLGLLAVLVTCVVLMVVVSAEWS